MRIKTAIIVMAMTTFALISLAGAAQASNIDATMQVVLADYLKIQKALAVDSTVGIKHAIHEIEMSAKDMHSGHAGGEQAEHFKHMRQDLLAACEKLDDAEDLDALRQGFQDLSKPVLKWVEMAKPKNTTMMYCPMKKASWVQEGSEVANPYLGGKMASCGEKVGHDKMAGHGDH